MHAECHRTILEFISEGKLHLVPVRSCQRTPLDPLKIVTFRKDRIQECTDLSLLDL